MASRSHVRQCGIKPAPSNKDAQPKANQQNDIQNNKHERRATPKVVLPLNVNVLRRKHALLTGKLQISDREESEEGSVESSISSVQNTLAPQTVSPIPSRSTVSEQTKIPEEHSQDPTQRCHICLEGIIEVDTVRLPCQHYTCRDCIQILFSRALVSEADFPARCCQPHPIDPATVRHFLIGNMEFDYEGKKIEYGTKNRIYCANPDCGLFLFPEDKPGLYQWCWVCKNRTCTMCKLDYHYGTKPEDCPTGDKNDELFKSLFAREGLQECPMCQRVIELEAGCYHIACICGESFCYLCQATWKDCDCPQFPEPGVTTDLKTRYPITHPKPNQLSDFRFERLEKYNDDNREARKRQCQHQNPNGSVRVEGTFRCEACWVTLHKNIYQCYACGARRCGRCISIEDEV